MFVPSLIQVPKMENRNAFPKFPLFCILFSSLFLTSRVECQESLINFEHETALSANMELASRQDGHGGNSIGGLIGGALPNPPPQNIPVGSGLGPGGLGPEFVPFGLNHVILIILPQFKTKYHHLPKWLSSSIKISMPITVFFDQLNVPPGMFLPIGNGGFSLPLGIPPPLRAPGLPLPPPPIPTITPMVSPNAGALPVTNPHTTSGYASYYPPNPAPPYITPHEYDEDGEAEEEEAEGEGYDTYYTDEGRKRRWKRHVAMSQNQTSSSYFIHSIPDSHKRYMFNIRKRRAATASFNQTVHKAERVTLLPKIEEVLSGAGMEGKSCLLRTICEVHEAPLNHYGLMGELLTMFFSVSKSVFAESHLPEYLEAETIGKSGNCTEYFKNCKNTLFSWEEIETKKKKRKLLSSTKTINEV